MRGRQARRPSRQCGSDGAPRSERSTEYAGRGARAADAAVENHPTRQSRTAYNKIATAKTAHLHSPPAATW